MLGKLTELIMHFYTQADTEKYSVDLILQQKYNMMLYKGKSKSREDTEEIVCIGKGKSSWNYSNQ